MSRKISPGAVADHQIECIRAVCRHIEANLEQPLTLDALGEHAGLSPSHLQRLFKKVTGISPRQYADACRLDRLKSRLKERRTVTMAMVEAGYGSSSRLYERAADQLGMTPATYQRGGPTVPIHYTIADSPLGRLLLGATDRGICAVSLGDEDRVLEDFLRKEYPAADVTRDDDALQPWITEIVEHLRGRQPHLALPLDVRATAFQWRVWQELLRIPYGETRSYRAIAAAIGQPKAVRAVGRACATNPVALVIPCHRAVREDGNLGGYRWGLGRKQALLKAEKASATPPTEQRER